MPAIANGSRVCWCGRMWSYNKVIGNGEWATSH